MAIGRQAVLAFYHLATAVYEMLRRLHVKPSAAAMQYPYAGTPASPSVRGAYTRLVDTRCLDAALTLGYDDNAARANVATGSIAGTSMAGGGCGRQGADELIASFCQQRHPACRM